MHRPSAEVLERFGLPADLWDLARSQLEAFAHHRKSPRVDALAELGRLARLGAPGERHTQDALRTHLRRRGHATRTALAASLEASPAPESIAAAREAAFRKGLLPEETEFSLEFRRLFPGTDTGIYLGTHSMGLPSSAAVLACLEHLMDVAELGIASWDDGILPRVMDEYGAAVDRLLGGKGATDRVVWYPNASEAMMALLEALPPTDERDELVFSTGHFTTGHYVHHQWCSNTGGTARAVVLDPLAGQATNTSRLLAAVGPRTRIVSLSHALFQSGFVQDIEAIAGELHRSHPEVVLIVDLYQTAGTIPIEDDLLRDTAILLGGAHKQLRASAGAGYARVPASVLPRLEPRRAGWWGHRAPFDFIPGPIQRPEDSVLKLQTGTPSLFGMVHLQAELHVLSMLGGGDLAAAVRHVRARTQAHTALFMDLLEGVGFERRSPRADNERAAFVCLHAPAARRISEQLLSEGVQLDYRPDTPDDAGAVVSEDGVVQSGILRLSSSSITLDYELRYVALRMWQIATNGGG